jgi:hypothetical protein
MGTGGLMTIKIRRRNNEHQPLALRRSERRRVTQNIFSSETVARDRDSAARGRLKPIPTQEIQTDLAANDYQIASQRHCQSVNHGSSCSGLRAQLAQEKSIQRPTVRCFT